jgi:ribosomal protein L37AE/L43A
VSNRRKLPLSARDQMDAAAADAWGKVRTRHAGRERKAAYDELPPAIRKVSDLLDDALERPARVCPHKDPHRAEPTHWFAAVPDMRMCDQCAAPFVDDWTRGVDECDLCRQTFPHGALTAITGAVGHIIIHAALCDGCYPEGADAPRAGGQRP